MIQQVNLYTPELRPKKERVQTGAALALVALVVLGLLVINGITQYQIYQLKARTASLNQQNQNLEQAVTQLSEAVQARQPDSAVQDALDRITDTLGRRQRLLNRVEGLVLDSSAGFSSQMAALARQIPDNVWLTGVRLDMQNAQVTIEGRASSGALVPDYLTNLSNEPAFAGRTFGAFRLSRPDKGQWIDFHVATVRSQEEH
ncbi:MAG TPA: PilN domain-containing protein [Marinobacter sp.]|nr:PilN domain-containing protein [Marinobacter sp.]